MRVHLDVEASGHRRSLQHSREASRGERCPSLRDEHERGRWRLPGSPDGGVATPVLGQVAILLPRRQFHQFELFDGCGVIALIRKQIDDAPAWAFLRPIHEQLEVLLALLQVFSLPGKELATRKFILARIGKNVTKFWPVVGVQPPTQAAAKTASTIARWSFSAILHGIGGQTLPDATPRAVNQVSTAQRIYARAVEEL